MPERLWTIFSRSVACLRQVDIMIQAILKFPSFASSTIERSGGATSCTVASMGKIELLHLWSHSRAQHLCLLYPSHCKLNVAMLCTMRPELHFVFKPHSLCQEMITIFRE